MIQVENLSRQFGDFIAVDNLSFSVKPGEVLGFLGPNGAGKSTTMKMLTGFLRPTSGQALIGGFNVEEEPLAARRLLGYLPESAPLYNDMMVVDFLRFADDLR